MRDYPLLRDNHAIGLKDWVSLKAKIIDEIREHGQVLDRQVFELYSAAPHADLSPRAFENLMIIHDSALNPV